MIYYYELHGFHTKLSAEMSLTLSLSNTTWIYLLRLRQCLNPSRSNAIHMRSDGLKEPKQQQQHLPSSVGAGLKENDYGHQVLIELFGEWKIRGKYQKRQTDDVNHQNLKKK